VLVTNPVSAFLPGQASLEASGRRSSSAGTAFRHAVHMANSPSADSSVAGASGNLESYLQHLVGLHPRAADGVMCRTYLSVGWDGTLYDCDFNQMLELPLAGERRSVWEIEELRALEQRPIATASHCFGCTAGAGSSCGGSLR
jgi:hypothetical protein